MTALADYLETYREAIHGVRYRDLPELQTAPFAAVAFGGGGTAYALAKLGDRRRAAAWLAAAIADRRSAAYDADGSTPSRASYLHGRAGLHVVRALVEPRGFDRALAGFVRTIRSGRSLEFADGAAGWLTAVRLLRERYTDPALDRLGERLAALLDRELRKRCESPWDARDTVAFAHGWTGVVHAAMAWQRARGLPPAGWLVDSLRELASEWSPEPVSEGSLAASWCNGIAGAVLMWTEAHAHTGEPAFLRCARDAAAKAARLAYPTADLCCGAGGVAFALLELDRVDPGHGWRQEAARITTWAIARASQHPMQWPNGLFRGHPGLICLALDLMADRPAGFPLIIARA